MCGIFSYISKTPYDISILKKQGELSKHRGPDNTSQHIYSQTNTFIFFLFHRLSINGLTSDADQPFITDDIIMMCNGEIYNYKELSKKYNIDLTTGSDCEIITHLYRLFGIDMINLLDGVFSFILFDKIKQKVYIGHDPIGIRSLYISQDAEQYIISSEMKCLTYFNKSISIVPPGIYYELCLSDYTLNIHRYYHFIYEPIKIMDDYMGITKIKTLLFQAVKKRLMSERPIGCLLSGGLDSSIIVYILSNYMDPKDIQTFSIGLQNSPDLKYAKIVADFFGTNHTSIELSEIDMLDAIEPTIQQIESYDTTTVRASVPMYLLSKYIKEYTDITVIFSGEGSDELSGSYLYFHKAPSPEEFQSECIRLLENVHNFDVLRGDKSTAGHGLEIRVPFFDKEFIKGYMTIDPRLKVVRNNYEKYLLRKSFEGTLPDTIIWRRKDGFSDGISKESRPWYSIINTYTQNTHSMDEKTFYKYIFKKYYRNYESIVPYEWLPKWTKYNNPSGRLFFD